MTNLAFDQAIRLYVGHQRENALLQLADAILPEQARTPEQQRRVRQVLAGMRLAWNEEDFDYKTALANFAMEIADIKENRVLSLMT